MSFANARRLHKFIIWANTILDVYLTPLAARLRLCGAGPRHNFSVLLSTVFFTDCACCVFYRGVALGLFSAVTFFVLWIAAGALIAHEFGQGMLAGAAITISAVSLIYAAVQSHR
jgi:hypothetical protein